MHVSRKAFSLLAGVVLLDCFCNLPCFSPAAPFSSLFAPSLDLLALLAALFVVSQVDQRAHRGLRIGFSVIVALILGLAAAGRLGFANIAAFLRSGSWGMIAAAASIAVVGLAVGFAVSLLSSWLVLYGFSHLTVRNLFLMAASLLAILHVVTRNRVFTHGVIPGLVQGIAALVR